MGVVQEGCRRIVSHAAFEPGVAVLITLNLVLLFPEIALQRLDPVRLAIGVIQETITAVFCLELVVRFGALGKPGRFFREYWLDLLAVIPVLRAFRIFRFMKLLRLLRLFRLARILMSQRRVARHIHRLQAPEYLMAGFLLLFWIGLGALSLTWFESAHSGATVMVEWFWTALFSTVSAEYIDSFPRTLGGRLIALGLELAGLILFAGLVSTVTLWLVELLKEGVMQKLKPEDLEDHLLVCGWNSGAASALLRLRADARFSQRAIAILSERDEFPGLSELSDLSRICLIREDYTRAEVLRKARVERAAVALLFPDNQTSRSRQDADARTVLAALTLEKLNPRLLICAELADRANEPHLRMGRIEDVVVSQDLAGQLLAQSVLNRSQVRLFQTLLHTDRLTLLEIDAELAGATFLEAVAALAGARGLVPVAVLDEDGAYRLQPGGERLQAGQKLVCFSST